MDSRRIAKGPHPGTGQGSRHAMTGDPPQKLDKNTGPRYLEGIDEESRRSVILDHDEFHIVSDSGVFVWTEKPRSMSGVEVPELRNTTAPSRPTDRPRGKLRKSPAAVARYYATARATDGPSLTDAEKYKSQFDLNGPSTFTSTIHDKAQPSTPRQNAARGMRVDTSRSASKPHQPPELSPTSWWKRINFGSPPTSPTTEQPPPPRSRAVSLSASTAVEHPPPGPSSRHRAESHAAAPPRAMQPAATSTRPTATDHYEERKKVRDEMNAKRRELELAHRPVYPVQDNRQPDNPVIFRGSSPPPRVPPPRSRDDKGPEDRSRVGRPTHTHIRTHSEPQPAPSPSAQAVPSSSRNRTEPAASTSARRDPLATTDPYRAGRDPPRRHQAHPQPNTRDAPKTSSHTNTYTRHTSDPPTASTLPHASHPPTHVPTSPTHVSTSATHVHTRPLPSTAHLPPDTTPGTYSREGKRSRKPSEASVPARTMSTMAEAGSLMSRVVPPPVTESSRRRTGR